MSYPSDDQIREGIKAIIVAKAPKALVVTRWTLGSLEQAATWPGQLQSQLDGGKVHGYVITRFNRQSDRAGSIWKPFFKYRIFGMHYLTSGTDVANSEKLFHAEVDAIAEEIDSAANANIAQAMRREPINIDLDVRQYGNAQLHTFIGTLIMEPCKI